MNRNYYDWLRLVGKNKRYLLWNDGRNWNEFHLTMDGGSEVRSQHTTNTKFISSSNEQLTSENNRLRIEYEIVRYVRIVVVPSQLWKLTSPSNVPPTTIKTSILFRILLSFWAITPSAVHICWQNQHTHERFAWLRIILLVDSSHAVRILNCICNRWIWFWFCIWIDRASAER